MKTLNERRDVLAEKYETEVLELNPGGFTVADYVNSDVLSSAFSLGFDAAVSELTPEIEKLVKLIQDEVDCEYNGEFVFGGTKTKFSAHDKENCIKCETLTEYKAFMGEK